MIFNDSYNRSFVSVFDTEIEYPDKNSVLRIINDHKGKS